MCGSGRHFIFSKSARLAWENSHGTDGPAQTGLCPLPDSQFKFWLKSDNSWPLHEHVDVFQHDGHGGKSPRTLVTMITSVTLVVMVTFRTTITLSPGESSVMTSSSTSDARQPTQMPLTPGNDDITDIGKGQRSNSASDHLITDPCRYGYS